MANKSKDESTNWIRKHLPELSIDELCKILYNYMSSNELEEFVEHLKDEGY